MTLGTTELFLIALAITFTVPYLVWRLGRTDYWAPLVVVQIVAGLLLGPGVLGRVFPDSHSAVFTPAVIQHLNGIALWGVMLLVWIAGIELDLKQAWAHRRESVLTAGFALFTPLLFGAVAAIGLLAHKGWIGPGAHEWQFVLGVGMACAVTALPVLIMLLEKLAILRAPLGQRNLRYASLDDVAIWGVLALIVMEWHRIGTQAVFLASFAVVAFGFRKLMARVPASDRWYLGLIWLVLCALGADWAGLHYMVGAFLAGVVLDSDWFEIGPLDSLRHNVMLVLMPVYFLSAGLKTQWSVGGEAVFVAAAVLLLASVAGKLAGVHLAGRMLRWEPGEASVIGWLLQTKGLITIVFANILLDKGIISGETFTALLLVAVASTMMTVPVVAPMLARLKRGVGETGLLKH